MRSRSGFLATKSNALSPVLIHLVLLVASSSRILCCQAAPGVDTGSHDTALLRVASRDDWAPGSITGMGRSNVLSGWVVHS